MRRRWSLSLGQLGGVLGLILSAACSNPPSPPPPDAGYLVGDAETKDAESPDRAADAEPTDRDIDVGSSDLGFAPDAEPSDARTDGGGGGPDGAIPDAEDPCRAPATRVLTTTQALAEPGLAGTVVDVVGTASIAEIGCTEQACPPENACCNRCVAEVWLDGLLPLRTSSCATRVGCEGDECNLVCTPPVLGIGGRYRGRIIDRRGRELELWRVLP